MDLGEYIFMRIGLALLIVAVVVGFRLIVALLGKALSYFTKSGGKNPDSKTPAQTRQPPKAPVTPVQPPKAPVVPQTPEVLKPPVIPQTPVTPKQPEPPKPPVTPLVQSYKPPVQSYQPPVQSYKPPVQGYQPQQYSGTVPLDPEEANGPWKTTPVTSSYSLRCVRGPMQGQRFPIGPQGCTIGRNPGSQIVFPAQTPGVSGNHCKLEVSFKNAYHCGTEYFVTLTDCNSTYGTYSGFGQRLPAGSGHPLQVGEAFFLGSPNGPGFVLEKQ